MKTKYTHSTHCVYNINYHLIWYTKYRKKLIYGNVEHTLKQLVRNKSRALGLTVGAMEVMPDHVHLFVVANPNMNIGTIDKYLKGYSSYHLRRIFTYLQKYPSLWTRTYFAESVEHISRKNVVKYIASQKSKTLSSPG